MKDGVAGQIIGDILFVKRSALPKITNGLTSGGERS
jgi:hypothetical protein